ncbi:MAG: hypothetical protein ACOYL5_10665 [Phototrophicaceae bacterium]
MSELLETTLSKAYELIEANRIDEAHDLLEPLLEGYPNESELWWMYAYAVDDPEKAVSALQRVVALDPTNNEAKALLDQATAEVTPIAQSSGIKPIRPIKPLSVMPATSPESNGEDADDDGDPEPTDTTARGGINWVAIAAVTGIFVIALIILGFTLLRNNTGNATVTPSQVALNATVAGGQSQSLFSTASSTVGAFASATPLTLNLASVTPLTPTQIALSTSVITATVVPSVVQTTPVAAISTPTTMASNTTGNTPTVAVSPTQQASNTPTVTATLQATVVPTIPPTPTVAPTSTNTPTPTTVPTATPHPTNTPTPDLAEQLIAALAGFDLSDQGVTRVATELGDTWLVEVCITAETDRTLLLDDGFSALAENIGAIPQNAQAIGIALLDCEAEAALRLVAVERATLDALVAGNLAPTEFQRQWRSVTVNG